MKNTKMITNFAVLASTQITRPVNGEIFKSNYYLSWLTGDLIILGVLAIIFLILLSFYIRNRIGMLFSSIFRRKAPTKKEAEEASQHGEAPSNLDTWTANKDDRSAYPLQRPQGLMD